MRTGVRASEHGPPVPPPALLEAVAEACRELAAAASGRVFEVPDNGIEPALQQAAAGGARYDTILSFMRTPQVADIEGFVAALEQILAEDGWICMVEPAATTAGPTRRRLAALLGRRSPRRGADTDVVAALRSGGLFVTDIWRRAALSAPPAWRHYVVLRARRQSPVGLEAAT